MKQNPIGSKEKWQTICNWIVIICLYKTWPWDDLDLYYGKVNIGRPCIRMGKIVKMSFEGKSFMEMGKWTECL